MRHVQPLVDPNRATAGFSPRGYSMGQRFFMVGRRKTTKPDPGSPCATSSAIAAVLVYVRDRTWLIGAHGLICMKPLRICYLRIQKMRTAHKPLSNCGYYREKEERGEEKREDGKQSRPL